MLIALLVIVTYFLANLIGYGVHRALHCEWSGLYKDHYYHHWRVYPPHDFLSDEYREPPLSASQAKYYLAATALLFTPYLYFGWAVYDAALAGAVVILKLNAYVHDSLHVRGHWLERFKTFHKLRSIHFEHHVVDKNFGIFDFTADLLFRTFKPHRASKKGRLLAKEALEKLTKENR